MNLIDFSGIVFQSYFKYNPTTINDLCLCIVEDLFELRETLGGSMLLLLDSKRNFRKDIYPSYKEHRKANRDDKLKEVVYGAMNRLEHELPRNGVPLLCVHGLEADDLIASVCHAFLGEGNHPYTKPRLKDYKHIFIVSTDRDLYQLVPEVKNPNKFIKIYNPVKKRFIDTGYFWNMRCNVLREKIYGGCKSDNIKPVYKGLGEKSVKELLKFIYKSKAASFKNVSKILEKLKEKEVVEAIELNKLLVTLPFSFKHFAPKYEKEVGVKFEPLTWTKFNKTKFENYITKLRSNYGKEVK